MSISRLLCEPCEQYSYGGRQGSRYQTHSGRHPVYLILRITAPGSSLQRYLALHFLWWSPRHACFALAAGQGSSGSRYRITALTTPWVVRKEPQWSTTSRQLVDNLDDNLVDNSENVAGVALSAIGDENEKRGPLSFSFPTHPSAQSATPATFSELSSRLSTSCRLVVD